MDRQLARRGPPRLILPLVPSDMDQVAGVDSLLKQASYRTIA